MYKPFHHSSASGSSSAFHQAIFHTKAGARLDFIEGQIHAHIHAHATSLNVAILRLLFGLHSGIGLLVKCISS